VVLAAAAIVVARVAIAVAVAAAVVAAAGKPSISLKQSREGRQKPTLSCYLQPFCMKTIKNCVAWSVHHSKILCLVE
jgi:hypothetical protein